MTFRTWRYKTIPYHEGSIVGIERQHPSEEAAVEFARMRGKPILQVCWPDRPPKDFSGTAIIYECLEDAMRRVEGVWPPRILAL